MEVPAAGADAGGSVLELIERRSPVTYAKERAGGGARGGTLSPDDSNKPYAANALPPVFCFFLTVFCLTRTVPTIAWRLAIVLPFEE